LKTTITNIQHHHSSKPIICRWGIVAGIVGASVALAVIQTTFEQFGKKGQQSGEEQNQQRRLVEPTKPSPSKPEGKWTAPLWQSAQQTLRNAKKFTPK
jgi:hypothetical protein